MPRAIPSSPFGISDPTLDREAILLSEAERAALAPPTFAPTQIVGATAFALGCLLTVAAIKVTTGIPIDHAAELDAVRAAVVQAAFLGERASQGQNQGQNQSVNTLCLSVQGHAVPGPALLANLQNLGPDVRPAADCRLNTATDAASSWVELRYVHWRWGGRAVVSARTPAGLQRYFVQHRRHGWEVIAVRSR